MAEYIFDREFGDVTHGDSDTFDIDHIGESESLASKIKTAFPGKAFRTVCDGEVLTVHTEVDWTAGEQVTLASLVVDHKADQDLDSYKAQRCAEIDQKSNLLMAPGFEYNGETFSMSSFAQVKLLGLRTAAIAGVLVDPGGYPIPYACVNEATHMITGEADLIGMFNTGFARMQGILATGAMLKGQCVAAEDQAALGAIVDNRT